MLCNHRYTESSSIRAKHTHTHLRKCERKDMLCIAWHKKRLVQFIDGTNRKDESKKWCCCNSNLESAKFCVCAHKNTSFVHNLYQAIISIFMHKRFLPRRLYHNPLERHRFFSPFHCWLTLFASYAGFWILKICRLVLLSLLENASRVLSGFEAIKQ